MNFDLTPEQTEFQAVMRAFADQEVAPGAAERDRTEEFPLEVVRKMAELGLFGLPFPQAYGGSEADALTFCLAIEELGRVDQSVGITLSAVHSNEVRGTHPSTLAALSADTSRPA